MSATSIGRAGVLGGAAIAALGLAGALLGTVTGVGGAIAPLLGLAWPPIGLAIGAMARRISDDRVRGDALAVRGGMHCHLFALLVAVLLAGGWLLLGVPSSPLAVLAWGGAAAGYAGFAYAWDRATSTDVDAVEGVWRS